MLKGWELRCDGSDAQPLCLQHGYYPKIRGRYPEYAPAKYYNIILGTPQKGFPDCRKHPRTHDCHPRDPYSSEACGASDIPHVALLNPETPIGLGFGV